MSSETARRARKLAGGEDGGAADVESASRSGIHLDAQTAENSGDQLQFGARIVPVSWNDEGPIEIAAVVVDGSSAGNPTQDGKAGSGRDLGPGILVSPDYHAGIVDVQQKEGRPVRRKREKRLFQGEICGRIAAGCTQRFENHAGCKILREAGRGKRRRPMRFIAVCSLLALRPRRPPRIQ